ncbi:unnamed protein product [Hermetia illucens]|uniref:RING-type domain-containing protein n=1 Tax=Hermetia illucens TaxID=343691 RepID=A0A7R8YZZ7_HERIL|nr:E3 ubiquitin-protein ligase RNF220 [Hermetia illucens]CAD7092109.1 unnamed protein product [Hermetia illucens]
MENLSEEGRGFRSRKKQTDPFCCPVCGVTVRASELEQHFAMEVDRLVKLQLNQKVKKSLNNGNTYHDPLPGCSSNGDSGSSGCPWVTFQKIRNNRHSRLRIKTRKRKADEPICPICNERPTEDINVHVELCLRKSENKSENSDRLNGSSVASDDDESIDIEGETFDEYEWAGQKRVRVSSMLQGGYSAAGIGTSISNCSDDDEDLNVDGDDTQIYGPPQYTERDVIVPISGECEKEENENIYLRKLVTGHDVQTLLNSSDANSEISGSLEENNDGIRSSTSHSDRLMEDNKSPSTATNTFSMGGSGTDSQGQVIECLKAKIREYENQISNKIKCLICMDEFKKPAVSICCWHVHCEECWLRTLGARKLCPQCNMITSPSDLRRIYM